MPYDIGPRVGVTGEKEFNRQMREINDTIKLLGSQMNALSKEYDDNADSLEYLSKRNDLLNDVIQLMTLTSRLMVLIE